MQDFFQENIPNFVEAKPILKWAGGKSQLLPQINKFLPNKVTKGKIKRYIEPFVGGGAVFFDLIKKYKFSEVVLSDINLELVILYKLVRDDIYHLIEELEKIQREYDVAENKSSYYYNMRMEYNSFDKKVSFASVVNSDNFIRRAALTVFLNKTCFNGLYRVNRKGEFNVPIGSYINPRIFDKSDMINASIALQNSIILHGDFEETDRFINKDSFVYYDPPYRPVSKTSAFISYSSTEFDDVEQKRLKDFFDKAHRKGALQMLSNSDPTNYVEDSFFDDLYRDYKINRIYAKRSIRATGTQYIRELLITNY